MLQLSALRDVIGGIIIVVIVSIIILIILVTLVFLLPGLFFCIELHVLNLGHAEDLVQGSLIHGFIQIIGIGAGHAQNLSALGIHYQDIGHLAADLAVIGRKILLYDLLDIHINGADYIVSVLSVYYTFFQNQSLIEIVILSSVDTI